MGVFLRGRIVTWVSTLVVALFAAVVTFFYAWSFSRDWPNPTTMVKVLKGSHLSPTPLLCGADEFLWTVFAMVFAALYSFQGFLTVHSLRLKSKSLSFGLWSVFGLGSIVTNMWWFALMVSRGGFDALCGSSSSSCSRKNITIAFTVFMFAYGLVSLIVMLIVFHFDAHWNELPAGTTAAPSTTTTSGLFPKATTATTAQSLAKKLLPSRLGFSFSSSKRNGAASRRGVPLISVSRHDSLDDDAMLPTHRQDTEDGVLFDAKHRHEALKTDEFAASSSESEDSEHDTDDDQLEYEKRRRERKGKYREVISIDLDPLTGLPRGLNTTPFKLEDYPIDNAHRKLKVAMIGAGFSGITAGIRIDQRLKNIDLAIYEKNKSVGGTWFENSYPGLCCDIPAHCYSLTFEPNHHWSKFYAPGPEILKYLQDVAAKYKLDRFIRYRHKLTRAEWNEETAQWSLSFDILGEQDEKIGEKVETADIVIQGMGGLARWDWPNIEGIHDFKGTKLHSAAYPYGAENEKGKTVAVIGSGSSSIQIVPALQPHAARVDNYVRGSTWIASPFASTELLKRKPDASNYEFTEEEKKNWAENPAEYHQFRKNMEKELNAVHGVTLKGSALQRGAVDAFAELMKKKLASKPHIAEKLIPTFPVACRRLTPGPGYLEALVEPNVEFLSHGIKRITETGIESADGTHREYDTIICATGFDTSYRPRIPIIGRNGTNVQDLWSDVPSSYLTMLVGPDHPNFFVVNGPNSSLGSGSLLVLFEREVDYIVQCIDKMQRENYKTMSAKQEAVNDFMAYVHTYFQKTVYSEKCRSWYKKGMEEGPVVALWPGSCLHAIKALKHPRWEDFDYTFSTPQNNRFAWLGSGWSYEEMDGSEGDTAFYLEEIDIPPVPV
ncbi:hypothetical protein JCM5296_001482 [Sporobolomyces johnsonii]